MNRQKEREVIWGGLYWRTHLITTFDIAHQHRQPGSFEVASVYKDEVQHDANGQQDDHADDDASEDGRL